MAQQSEAVAAVQAARRHVAAQKRAAALAEATVAGLGLGTVVVEQVRLELLELAV